MYKRLLKDPIEQKFFLGKVIIVTGARQVGKTTLSGGILENYPKEQIRFFNCDNPTDRELLGNKDLEFLKQLIGNARIVVIDEGQKVENIGQTLKLIVDYYKEKKQIIVTGSSSINLLSNTQEALTGRKYVFTLYPLSLEEIYPDKNQLTIFKELESLLVFGTYPDIVKQKSFDEKTRLLQELRASYLYKDILEFQQVKDSDTLTKLLKALALQIGSEVSYNELSSLVGIDKRTIEHYVDLLEKSYVVFRLSPYTKNKRREISKLRKIYFYDLGIRNAIINNFNFLANRNDTGALWENFMIIERLKYRMYHNMYANQYFWRTYDGSEVDLVEEREGKLFGYEFKWGTQRKTRSPEKWLEYPESSFEQITVKDLAKLVL